MTLLYNVSRESLIRIKDTGELIFFHHIDGMYSFCTDMDNIVCHLVAWCEVEDLGSLEDEKVRAYARLEQEARQRQASVSTVDNT